MILLLAVLALGAWVGWSALRRARRDRLLHQPLPDQWAAILERNVPISRRLPPELRRSLDGLVNVFLAEKGFEGCAGLEINDEIRVTVAGSACLLLLGRGRRGFPGFKTILVYPDSFVTRQTSYDGMVEINEETVRSGESWERGPVVLAWSDVVEDLEYAGDGRNVILHEFAHKLDEENASVDGLPVLRDGSQHAEWARVLTREYESLQRQVDAGADPVLDPYGAESPAEFFAVATEAFFEQPGIIRSELPDLYEQLRGFYNLDPAGWRA